MKNEMIRQRIPAGVLELAQRGLNLLELALKDADPNSENDKIGYDLFDIMTLRGLLKGEVFTDFTKKEKETFVSKHGVDFPIYLGEENQPVELKLDIEKEKLERRFVLLKQNADHIVKELIKRGFKTVEHETLGAIINGDSEGELGSAITDLYIISDLDSDYADVNFRTDKEYADSKKKPNIQIEKIASIEVDRDTLDVFREHSAMDEEQAVFIMLENVEGLIEDGLEDEPELKEFTKNILDELEEDIEYIHFYSL